MKKVRNSLMVVNAQLKRIYSFPSMKPYDGAALIKYARIVSSCVNILTQFNYMGDLNSEGVLGSAIRKLTLDMKTKWLTYFKQMNLYHPGLFCRQTRMLIARSRATKKRQKAPRLQHQLQTPLVTTRNTSESVC